MRRTMFILLAFLVSVLAGCGGGGGATSGAIQGVVVDASDPSVPVGNAYCYIPIPPARGSRVARAEVIENYTDSQGRYRLEAVPPGEDLPLIVEPTPESSLDFVRTELSVRAAAGQATSQEVAVITPTIAGQITGIVVSPESAVVRVGETKQFAAEVTGYSGTLKPTWWVTGGIGTVDDNGLFTASSVGTGAVHAGLGSLTAQATVNTVPQGTVLQGIIAFASERDGNHEVYIMNPDGSNQTNLTNNPAWDLWPCWSPDGSKIAFTSDRDGNNEIYVMNSDGSNPVNLTNNLALDYEPSWSPDGSKIAFDSDRDGNHEVYVMNSDGSNQTRLTNNLARDGEPSWSPDGSKIAFYSERDGNAEIYVMNPDGTNQTDLTNNAGSDFQPSWSPDGSKIAFTSYRDGNPEIYVMNSDGTNQTRLSNNSSDDGGSAWSPDGSKIAFHSDRDGNYEIYVMNSDGSNQINLTNNPARDVDPSWSPF